MKNWSRRAGRLIGWLLVAAALMAAGAELLASLEAGSWQPLDVGTLWFRLNVGSLNLAQALIQRYLHPAVWDPAITWLLLQPAWAVFGVAGLLLAWLCRRHPTPRGRLAL